jgi:hypothetical protein
MFASSVERSILGNAKVANPSTKARIRTLSPFVSMSPRPTPPSESHALVFPALRCRRKSPGTAEHLPSAPGAADRKDQNLRGISREPPSHRSYGGMAAFPFDERAGYSRGSQQADQRPLLAGVRRRSARSSWRTGALRAIALGGGGIFTRRRDADVGEFWRAKLGKAGKGPTVQVTTNQLSTPGGRSAQRWSGDGPLTASHSTGNWNQIRPFTIAAVTRFVARSGLPLQPDALDRVCVRTR